MRSITWRRLLAVALPAVLLAAVPVAALASHAPQAGHKYHHTHALTHLSGAELIAFGDEGGNIRPFTVTINADGSVTTTGVPVHAHRLIEPMSTLNGLLKLADAEHFFSLPVQTQCTGTLPDVASRYIEIHANGDSKRVAVHGGCVSSFAQLYGVLEAAVGFGQTT